MDKNTRDNVTQNNLEEANAFAIVSVEPVAYQGDEIAWSGTNIASSAGLTLEAMSGLEHYQLPQRVVIETLIPFSQGTGEEEEEEDCSDLTELVGTKNIETHVSGIDSASLGEDASIKSLDENKLDSEEINKAEVFSDLTGMLSASVIDAIPEDNPMFLNTLQANYNVAVNMTTNGASVSGSFSALSHLEKALRSLLFSGYTLNDGKEQFPTIYKETVTRPEMADKGITCNLLLPQVSFHGREVRRHPRYANSLSPFYSAFDEDQREASRKKRRVGRPRKKIPMQNNGKDKNVFQGAIMATDFESITDIDSLPDLPIDSSMISPQKFDEKFPSDFSAEQQKEEEEEEENDPEKDKDYFPSDGEFAGSNSRRITKKDYEALAPFKFFCKECSFKSKRESHFAKHLKLHEKARNLFQCKRCEFTSLRLSHLRRHEVLHSQTLLRCQQCKYSTDNSKLLARHVKTKHSTQQKQHAVMYTCPKCPYKTLQRHLYTSHLQLNHNQTLDAEMMSNGGSKSKAFQCNLCAYKTQRKEHYVRHQNNVHCNQRPYLCDLCGKAFKRPDALAQHKFTHMEKSARVLPFACTLCPKAFRSQAHLKEHQTMHSSVRSYLCHFCGASFKTRSVQQKHIQTIHVNPRSYNCSQCDKRFNTHYALRRHKHTHNTPGMRCELQQISPAEPTVSIQQVTLPNLTSLPAVCQEPQTLVQEVMAASPIEVTYDQSSDTIRQPLIQTNETTTALLYLTNNLSPF